MAGVEIAERGGPTVVQLSRLRRRFWPWRLPRCQRAC